MLSQNTKNLLLAALKKEIEETERETEELIAKLEKEKAKEAY